MSHHEEHGEHGEHGAAKGSREPMPGTDGEYTTDGGDAGEQAHHDAETEEDTASGGAPQE